MIDTFSRRPTDGGGARPRIHLNFVLSGVLLAFNTFKGSILGARTRKGSAGMLKLVSSGLALVAVHQLPPYPDSDS